MLKSSVGIRPFAPSSAARRASRAVLAAVLAAGLASGLAVPAALAASEAPPASVWLKLGAKERQAAENLAQDYMQFLGEAKVPLHRTRALTRKLEAAGFKPYRAAERWTPGAKFYLANRDRAMLAWIVGREPMSEGVRLVAAHLDSPRLDVRIRPLKAADNLMLMRGQPYGGIKRYQWSNLPLALVGQVARADGKLVDVNIGMKAEDPVFILPDLAPHVDKDYRTRSADAVFKGDELSVIVGAVPALSGGLKKAFLDALQERYGLAEEDFVSAELALVPAQAPREVGLDRTLIGGYGQDDGLCSFAAATALAGLSGVPARTAMAYWVDHEEVGNTNATGARSRFLVATLERLAQRDPKAPRDALSSLLENSEVLSADVSQALNPNFPGTEDPLTTARVGEGMSLKTMKPGFDASPAFRARMRKLLSDRQVPWQTYAYKVDGGGGATIGAELQELNMDVLDVGAPLLAMHGTFELSAKSDVYALERFFDAFYGQGR